MSKRLKSPSTGLCAGLLLCGFSGLAQAATFYVDPAGRDNNAGTQSSPFATLQRAADAVNPGDTVIANPGVYSSTRWTVVDFNRSGTANAWITFKSAVNGEARIANSPSSSYGFSFEPNANYIRVQGFDISGVSKLGLAIWSANHDIEVTDNHFHDIGRICTDSPYGIGGIYVQGSKIAINGNKFHDLGRLRPQEQGCQPRTAYYMNHDHGIYVDGASGITIKNNQIYNIERGWGIHVYSGSGKLTVGMLIEGNRFAFPNPYREGHITLASPGVQDVRIVANNFFYPNNKAIEFDSGAVYSSVTVDGNMSFPSAITSTSPRGVTFLSNK